MTARSLAGDGEGGPERDMVGVGLNTPDTDGSGREACSHVEDVWKTGFRRMPARRSLKFAGTPERDVARIGLYKSDTNTRGWECLRGPCHRRQGGGAGSTVEGTCSHLPSAVITAPFNAHICFRLISVQIRRGCPRIPAFLWFDWLPARSLHLSECHIHPFHGLAQRSKVAATQEFGGTACLCTCCSSRAQR